MLHIQLLIDIGDCIGKHIMGMVNPQAKGRLKVLLV